MNVPIVIAALVAAYLFGLATPLIFRAAESAAPQRPNHVPEDLQ